MDEDRTGDWPVAKEITALEDFDLPARIENIWRDGVRPPLLGAIQLIEVRDRYVLAVEVSPSPLGPYMVEFGGDRRHYIRHGTSVVPMTEQQVRDGYALAVRGSERRSGVWTDHSLPPEEPGMNDEPWLVVSAVPQEPLVDILSMAVVDAADLRPPEALATYINNHSLGDLTPTISSLARWVEGFHGRDQDYRGLHRVMRLHRDGAAAVAGRIGRYPVDVGYSEKAEQVISVTYVARVANTFLLYLGWFWDRFDLPRQVELRLELRNIAQQRLQMAIEGQLPLLSAPISGPVGVPVDHVAISEYVLPWEVQRASVRHQILMRFSDRLCQAGAHLRVEAGFRRGRLHDREGVNTNLVIGGGLLNDLNSGQGATVGVDGSIRSGITGDVVGWYDAGVVMDREGQAVAVLEFAPSSGCPDDFVGRELHIDTDGPAGQQARTPPAPASDEARPNPTRTWSPRDVRSMLEGR